MKNSYIVLRSFKYLLKYLYSVESEEDVDVLRGGIDDLILKTILSCESTIASQTGMLGCPR